MYTVSTHIHVAFEEEVRDYSVVFVAFFYSTAALFDIGRACHREQR